MYAILSPAKKLVEGPAVQALPATIPGLLDDAEALVSVAKGYDAEGLSSLMKISAKLGELNEGRFQAFETPFTRHNARQAARSFAGDTYVGFDAASLTEDDLAYAQDHVGILSGLYGLLRPLDLMQPYRLEMGTKMPNPKGKNLYAYWGDTLAQMLQSRVEGHQDPVIINLASNEYAKAALRPSLSCRVITPVFQEVKGGKTRVIGLMAKRARGSMARFIVQHRVEQVEALKAFAEGGYAFIPEDSTDERWIFRRSHES